MADLNWTDEQWQKVIAAVTEAFDKASVATAFLTRYGPVAGGTEIVRNERLLRDEPTTVTLDADHEAVNLKLVNVTVKVELSSEQVADGSLSNALLAFRRAGNILAQEQDRIVFAGHRRGDVNDSIFVANRIGPQKGLADLPARLAFSELNLDADGRALISAVVQAINELEGRSNPGPFACILGNNLFEAAHGPSQSLVLPADRLRPLLKGGALLSSGKMDANTGIVVSLAANAVDLVLGTPPTVQFLQRKPSAKFLFRVYARFALRIRDKGSMPVAGFTVRKALTNEQVAALTELKDDAAQVARLEEVLANARITLVERHIALTQARSAKAEAEARANAAGRPANAMRNGDYQQGAANAGDGDADVRAARNALSDADDAVSNAENAVSEAKKAAEAAEEALDAARRNKRGK